MGWLGLRWKRTLAGVVAVQVTSGSLYTAVSLFKFLTARTFDEGVVTYQVNLVFDDPANRRLNLTADADPIRARQVGQQLADFFEVPLVDQISLAK